MQGLCEMNGYWRYMLGEIPQPISPPEKELTPTTKEAFETKLMKWLTFTDSIRGAIHTTCTIDPMSHVGDMGLASEMWKRFESLYRDTRFIKCDSIFIRLSTQTLSDFDDVAHFADNIKRNSIWLKEIGTKDVLDWMYTTWFLHGLSSEYDSFRMMLTNNRKANQVKGAKTEPEFDSILEQVLSLDTQKKVSESRSMKNAFKATEAKKTPSFSMLSCPYCKKSGHTKDKCYYKHPERASEGFRERFKGRIIDLKSRNLSVRSPQDQDSETVNESRPRGYIFRTNLPTSALATRSHDSNWYFDNAASYHMVYDIHDFDNPTYLQPCTPPQDDITLADGSVIHPEGIDKVWFNFVVNGRPNRIFPSGVRYCTKLDTKLISLGIFFFFFF